jgi:hypothetical protein
MNNKPDLPEGWAMPDEMANKINKALNQKPNTPEDELQSALIEIAGDIALIEPDPVDWGGWLAYLVEQMGVEAQRRGKQVEFEQLLGALRRGFDK